MAVMGDLVLPAVLAVMVAQAALYSLAIPMIVLHRVVMGVMAGLAGLVVPVVQEAREGSLARKTISLLGPKGMAAMAAPGAMVPAVVGQELPSRILAYLALQPKTRGL